MVQAVFTHMPVIIEVTSQVRLKPIHASECCRVEKIEATSHEPEMQPELHIDGTFVNYSSVDNNSNDDCDSVSSETSSSSSCNTSVGDDSYNENFYLDEETESEVTLIEFKSK